MSARLELDDLPPRYRAQAEKQLVHREGAGAKLHLHRWKPL